MESWLGLIYQTLAQNSDASRAQRLADWKRARDAYAHSAALWAAQNSESQARYRLDIAQVAQQLENCNRQLRLLESD